MKKWWLSIAAVLLMMVFVGCSNFSFTRPIGTPTVTISLGGKSLSQDSKGNWILSFTVNAHTLPGSAAGVINNFALSSGSYLSAGLRVEQCEPTVETDCGPYSIDYSLTFSSLPPENSYVITAYTVVGQNGSSYTIDMPEPLVIR